MEFSQHTILHVDDYAPGRYARTKLLRQAGFHVREADAGSKALLLAIEYKPQLALLDVNLPDMSGFEVCRRLKQDPATAGILVVHLSATKIEPSDQVQGVETGADAYLVEPIEPDVLLATVRAMLRAQQSEQALALITAQEEERRRVARELHDDIGQRLAALLIELEMVQKTQSADGDLGGSLRSMTLQLQALSDDVGSMSHRLHPTVLEDLGIESALRELVAEFRRIHDMEVSLVCDRQARPLPVAVSTGLYRIAQEALRNAAKHASGAPVTLTLNGAADRLRLVIEDSGAGFQFDAPRREGALGLISMRERARLAGGTLLVGTEPGKGTRIEASVPCTVEVRE